MSLTLRQPWMFGLTGASLCAFLPMLLAAGGEGSDLGNAAVETQVLVLKSGRIVEGHISQSAGGFVVEKSRGSMLIPFEQVQLRASDRKDAYQKLRITFPDDSAEAHVVLARWCLTYQLFDECRSELRAALTAEPNHGEARSMLLRLNDLLDPDGVTHSTPPQPEPRTPDGFQELEATSLAGLSRESVRQFAARVQPILLNNCGNASCHGSGRDGGLRLTHKALGRSGHRVFAEQNLAQTLQFVDAERPLSSPLLVLPASNHGRGGRAVFHGPRGARQQKTLAEWVTAVAAEVRSGRDSRSNRLSLTASDRRDESSETLIRGRQPDVATQATAETEPLPDDPLEAILRDERPDAFDPEIFNRMVHGSQSKDDDQR